MVLKGSHVGHIPNVPTCTQSILSISNSSDTELHCNGPCHAWTSWIRHTLSVCTLHIPTWLNGRLSDCDSEKTLLQSLCALMMCVSIKQLKFRLFSAIQDVVWTNVQTWARVLRHVAFIDQSETVTRALAWMVICMGGSCFARSRHYALPDKFGGHPNMCFTE